jgi:transcriptional regulator GlxA family with amidase domain
MTVSVGIYLFENVEVLDFAGPFEVFTTASRVILRRNPGKEAPFKVFTVAKTIATVQARAGLKTLPDFSINDCPRIDLLLIPGGVVDEEVRDERVIAWVRATAAAAQLTASVCTGAFILAKAGLLDQKRATTHWEDIDDLRSQFPEVQVQDGVRWVDEGQVVSSAGIAAGIDMSLHLVARLAGSELAAATARQMDVPYRGDT